MPGPRERRGDLAWAPCLGARTATSHPAQLGLPGPCVGGTLLVPEGLTLHREDPWVPTALHPALWCSGRTGPAGRKPWLDSAPLPPWTHPGDSQGH